MTRMHVVTGSSLMTDTIETAIHTDRGLNKQLLLKYSVLHPRFRECSGSVVECLNRDQVAAGSSLAGVTALCP